MDLVAPEETGNPARVVIVDAQPLLRLGLQVTLEREPDVRIVGTAAQLDEVQRACRGSWPNVLLLNRSLCDPRCPDVLELVEQLRRDMPDVRVILLAQGVDELDARRAMRAGAWGYLPITIAPRALGAAVRAVHAGEIALPRSLAQQFLVEATARSAAS